MIKLFEEFINEAKITFPLKMPSGASSYNNRWTWYKRSGYVGGKTIQKYLDKCTELKWTEDFKHNTTPNDNVSNNWQRVSPDENWKLTAYSHYGETASDNSYELSLEYIGKEDLNEYALDNVNKHYNIKVKGKSYTFVEGANSDLTLQYKNDIYEIKNTGYLNFWCFRNGKRMSYEELNIEELKYEKSWQTNQIGLLINQIEKLLNK